jgi:hypothetical protein
MAGELAMTLHTPTLSDAALRTLEQGLGELAQRQGFEDRRLAAAAPAALAVAAPHDVYSLGLEDLAAGRGLEAAEWVSRRCLILDGDHPIAAAELPDPDGANGFTTTEGRFAATTATAIQGAEDAPGEYELRLLRIPALYLMALWLKDRNGTDDVLVPLDPAPAELQPNERYSDQQLLERLRDRARSRLEFDG